MPKTRTICGKFGSEILSFSSIGEIDRIGQQFCKKPFAKSLVELVQKYRRYRMRCMHTGLDLLVQAGLPRHALISARLKRLDTIQRKISRKNSDFRLGRLDDIVGIRVVCESIESASCLSSRIKQMDEFYREKNYVESSHPAGTGYRAIHHIIRFEQALSGDKSIPVRFEIQVRTFLQNQWEIWSESHGEATKIGQGDVVTARKLRIVSERVAKWESRNPTSIQSNFPEVLNTRNVVVAWRYDESAIPLFQFFDVREDAAVDWLNFLELQFPLRRGNALLLVGISDPRNAIDVLKATHPLYTGHRVPAPEFWMPSDS